jgi:hypothetical protein
LEISHYPIDILLYYVAHVLFHRPLIITFRRSLDDAKWARWTRLVTWLMDIHLSVQPGNFVWKLIKLGVFMVKPLYLDYMADHARVFFTQIH